MCRTGLDSHPQCAYNVLTMKTSIATFGNSKGVRIPKPLLQESGLGAQVEITAKKGEIRIRPAREETAMTAEAMLAERALSDWNRSAEDTAWASLQ